MLSKLNAKKVAIAVACVLLLAPASVASSSTVQATPVCQEGELIGVRVRVTQPSVVTIMFSDDVCLGTPQPKRGTA
jgi:hypothetical protein